MRIDYDAETNARLVAKADLAHTATQAAERALLIMRGRCCQLLFDLTGSQEGQQTAVAVLDAFIADPQLDEFNAAVRAALGGTLPVNSRHQLTEINLTLPTLRACHAVVQQKAAIDAMPLGPDYFDNDPYMG